jgi:hypothetical protein
LFTHLSDFYQFVLSEHHYWFSPYPCSLVYQSALNWIAGTEIEAQAKRLAIVWQHSGEWVEYINRPPSFGAAVLTIRRHSAPVVALCASVDSTIIVSASNDRTLRVHDTLTGEEKIRLRTVTSADLEVSVLALAMAENMCAVYSSLLFARLFFTFFFLLLLCDFNA